MTTNPLDQIVAIFETTLPALHPNFGQALIEFHRPRFLVHIEVDRLIKGHHTNVAEPKCEGYLNSAVDVGSHKLQDECRASVDIYHPSLGNKVIIIWGIDLYLRRLVVVQAINIKSVTVAEFFIVNIWSFIKCRVIVSRQVKCTRQLKTNVTEFGDILTYEITRRGVSTSHLVHLYVERAHIHQSECEEVVIDNAVMATKLWPADMEVTPTSDPKESHHPLRALGRHKSPIERVVRSMVHNKFGR